ncbi:putative tail-length tape measure protein [Erwinia phage phiEaP8]|uniref:Tail-length tape measure protein n=2 Tax=Caudoviricetes TaxID=2731619 RepID=A0AB39ACI7_9CAUD|nr:putative tail-length tape measure protein [Erwinia phage phiEaP8]AWN06197.1 putative tail-length tape measure protein [Erwinia phage phiEaP8]
MADNIEVHVQMARLEERLKIITEGLAQDRESRKQQYEATAEITKILASLDNRVGVVEKGFAESAPTIEEFITIKHRVVGAGLAGKWIWAGAGAILTFLFTFRKEIIAWLSK